MVVMGSRLDVSAQEPSTRHSAKQPCLCARSWLLQAQQAKDVPLLGVNPITTRTRKLIAFLHHGSLQLAIDPVAALPLHTLLT